MKTVFTFFIALAITSTATLFLACSPVDAKSNQLTDQKELPVGDSAKSSIAFTESSYNFNSVPYGIPVRHVFEFTNTGSADLLLTNVKPTCHCTTPQWSRDPVKPGEKGTITVEFDAKASGVFKKSVTVTTNGDPAIVMLNFSGEVQPAGE